MKSFNLLTHVDGDADALFRSACVPHYALPGVWLQLELPKETCLGRTPCLLGEFIATILSNF
jgi:hypothetical protein